MTTLEEMKTLLIHMQNVIGNMTSNHAMPEGANNYPTALTQNANVGPLVGFEDDKDWISKSQAANLLCISLSMVSKLAKRGRLSFRYARRPVEVEGKSWDRMVMLLRLSEVLELKAEREKEGRISKTEEGGDLPDESWISLKGILAITGSASTTIKKVSEEMSLSFKFHNGRLYYPLEVVKRLFFLKPRGSVRYTHGKVTEENKAWVEQGIRSKYICPRQANILNFGINNESYKEMMTKLEKEGVVRQISLYLSGTTFVFNWED
jgi:hypothetical protein